MENEELLWKLHNGDLCSPKRSPTSPAIPFQSPRNSGSFPSPSISPRWPSWELETDCVSAVLTHPQSWGVGGRGWSHLHWHAQPVLELESHGPTRPLPDKTRTLEEDVRLVQETPPQTMLLEWIYMDAVAQSTYRTRRSCSLPFSPTHKGENSQGPVKIKIYITFVTFFTTDTFLWFTFWSDWGCVNEVDVTECHVSDAASFAESVWRCANQIVSVCISAKAIEERAVVARTRILYHQPRSALCHGGGEGETERALTCPCLFMLCILSE